jgi:membrane protease subunit HflC
MKNNYITLTISAFFVIIFGFMLFTFQVRETEVAIKTWFLKAVVNDEGKADIKPGFHFRLPWPAHDVHKFDKRIQSSEWTFEETGTIDAQPILVKVFVSWKISDALKFLNSFGDDMAKANEVLENKVRSAQNAVIGNYAFNNLVTTNKEELKLDEIEAGMKKLVGADTRGDGIEIIMVGIKRLGIPESVTSAVFERMKAERQAEIQKIEAEGERQAKTIKAEADLEANKILALARAEAIQISGEAEARAAKSYEVFKQNPELANFLFNRKALEGLLKENATLILDPNTPPFNLLTQPNPGKDAK